MLDLWRRGRDWCSSPRPPGEHRPFQAADSWPGWFRRCRRSLLDRDSPDSRRSCAHSFCPVRCATGGMFSGAWRGRTIIPEYFKSKRSWRKCTFLQIRLWFKENSGQSVAPPTHFRCTRASSCLEKMKEFQFLDPLVLEMFKIIIKLENPSSLVFFFFFFTSKSLYFLTEPYQILLSSQQILAVVTDFNLNKMSN